LEIEAASARLPIQENRYLQPDFRYIHAAKEPLQNPSPQAKG
jgi:hypothetical protein